MGAFQRRRVFADVARDRGGSVDGWVVNVGLQEGHSVFHWSADFYFGAVVFDVG